MPRFRTVALGEKAFERANRDRLVDRAAAAGGLAGMRADAAADARHRVRIARVTIGFLEPPFRDQRHIAARVGARRAGHHAREVGVQPFPVDLLVLKPIQHDGLAALDDVLTWPA